ncbi:NUDIX HYDROLASE 2 [Salix viminalis]|uniref:NUDIX HYDROLASE 2 n=1 Tax=Salix viminalis TaxID=40686 RepID=A0A9Q0UVW8_SALVM|nr:NUDIX HYDROLASE 2 [Salix viminalis]
MSSPSTSVLKGKTVLPADKIQQIGLLYAVNDKYGGVMVDMKEPMDSHIYVPLLRASISQWRQQGKKGVWIKLPIQLANLVEPTVKEGFRYHHAESDYLMLVHWIPDSPDALPANASHIVGIGAFVMNNKREVLVVKEKHGYFEGKDVWKFPTGVVNQGEDICTAAIREVKEETGIDTEFMEILAFRQTHKQFLGKSDLFFVCMLRPLSFDITKQDSEIKAAQWIPIDEYVNQTYNREHKSFEYIARICSTKSQGSYGGFSAVRPSSGKQNYLYFNGQDFKP